MSTIDDAARILRVGNQFSETNQKLRKAVDSFITRLAHQLGEEEIPGWEVHQYGNDNIGISFPGDLGKYLSTVKNNSPKQAMEIIHGFCETLAGEEGEKLITWLENKTKERGKFTEEVEHLLFD